MKIINTLKKTLQKINNVNDYKNIKYYGSEQYKFFYTQKVQKIDMSRPYWWINK